MKNKEITIYELMGLIKDDKAPKKIKIGNHNLHFNGDYAGIEDMYYSDYDTRWINVVDIKLNTKVEILSEENDEWEDICELLDDSRYNFSDRQNGMTQEDRRLLDSNFKTLGETINQLIKNQRKIIEKLESKDENLQNL